MWNIIGAISVLLICSVFLIYSFQFGQEAQLFPQIIVAVTVAFTIKWLISSIKDQIKNPQKLSIQMDRQILKMVIVTFASMLVYIFLVRIIGFYIVTFLFLILLMYVLGGRRYVIMLATSITMMLLIWLIFDAYLYLRLPQGYFF